MYDTQDYRFDLVAKMIGQSAQKMSGKTLLWTGTNGFLGTWVVGLIGYLNEHVLETPCKLIAIDLRIPDDAVVKKFEPLNVEFRSHDLTTKLWPVAEKIDYVVHMAGIASPHHYKKRPLETVDVCLEGVRSALEIARHSGAKFLFTSSSEVYQTADVIPTPETYIGAIASNNERSCYDVSKLMGENFTYIYSKNLGVDAVTIRIFNSFGPGIAEHDFRILPRIASSMVSGSEISVFAKKQQPTRTYCPTGNTVAGMFLALLDGRSGEIYNIGCDKPEVTVLELLDIIEKQTGKSVNRKVVEPLDVYTDEPLRRCPDITKAKEHLGYSPDISLEQ
ncbi:MAG: NAD-dependent epimerase/dehydratase family protein, partial [Rhodospirillaceae bacterium]